jgi:hypothetical protein
VLRKRLPCRRLGLKLPYFLSVQATVFDPEADVSSFFHDHVRGAALTRGYDPEAPSALYLVALLADYARPDTLSRTALQTPLTLLLRDALASTGPERFERLRGLGDHALYVSGFFADHLERRGLERKYVEDVGATAYDAAATMLRRVGSETRGPDVFDELAHNFTALVGLLADVADALYASSAKDPRGLLELYERWTRRGSKALAEALVRSGVIPTRGSGALH